MTIYDKEKMKQKSIYPTEQTPSYADWSLFEMGKALEESIPTITNPDVIIFDYSNQLLKINDTTYNTTTGFTDAMTTIATKCTGSNPEQLNMYFKDYVNSNPLYYPLTPKTVSGSEYSFECAIVSELIIVKVSASGITVARYTLVPGNGTTGQVLTKNSNDYMDISWATPSGGGMTAHTYSTWGALYTDISNHMGSCIISSSDAYLEDAIITVDPDFYVHIFFRFHMAYYDYNNEYEVECDSVLPFSLPYTSNATDITVPFYKMTLDNNKTITYATRSLTIKLSDIQVSY